MQELLIIKWLTTAIPVILMATGLYMLNLRTISRIPGILCVGLIGFEVVYGVVAYSKIFYEGLWGVEINVQIKRQEQRLRSSSLTT